ncbi:MAG TPA: hypothetical protein VJ140_19965 [Actinomycetota bacterium]|nr:hypothetical protein [Actinomycetota bacterium]
MSTEPCCDFGDGQPAPCRAGKTTLAHMVIASRAAVTWSPTRLLSSSQPDTWTLAMTS